MNNKTLSEPNSNQALEKGKRVYRVLASSCQSYCIYVQAASELEAIDIAEHVDGNYWMEHNVGDWEVENAELVVDTSSVELLPKEAHNTL